MPWPVSVVVPHQKSRSDFFRNYCLPSIEASNPTQILIEGGSGGACEKRNAGALKAEQPYILFVDDDTILRKDCLEKMVGRLEKEPKAGYAYSDYAAFAWPGIQHSEGPSFIMKSRAFDGDQLRKWNYIDTTSLIRRDIFPRFDRNLRRLQDWDLWLTLLDSKITGSYIDQALFMKFSIDRGISQTVPVAPAAYMVAEKHQLNPKETGMWRSGVPALTVFSHPNHEISVYGLMLRECPKAAYLTDGGGGERLAATERSNKELGVRAVYLNHSEASFYEAILRKDMKFWSGVVDEVAKLIGDADPDQILCDAVEYYNPVHDMSLPLVQAALKKLDFRAAVLAVPLVWERSDGTFSIQRALPEDRSREFGIDLSGHESARKKAALLTHYGALRAQMGFTDLQVEQACRTEYLVQACSYLREPDPGCHLRYDRRGHEAKAAGKVQEAISHKHHYLPVIKELLA